MKKTYRVTKFDAARTIHSEHASWGAAASALRGLGPDYFIQGRNNAWFFEDVAGKQRCALPAGHPASHLFVTTAANMVLSGECSPSR